MWSWSSALVHSRGSFTSPFTICDSLGCCVTPAIPCEGSSETSAEQTRFVLCWNRDSFSSWARCSLQTQFFCQFMRSSDRFQKGNVECNRLLLRVLSLGLPLFCLGQVCCIICWSLFVMQTFAGDCSNLWLASRVYWVTVTVALLPKEIRQSSSCVCFEARLSVSYNSNTRKLPAECCDADRHGWGAGEGRRVAGVWSVTNCLVLGMILHATVPYRLASVVLILACASVTFFSSSDTITDHFTKPFAK